MNSFHRSKNDMIRCGYTRTNAINHAATDFPALITTLAESQWGGRHIAEVLSCTPSQIVALALYIQVGKVNCAPKQSS